MPLIVWSKKLFKRPRTIEALTSHIDLAPTLLGLAGIDPEPIRKRLVRNHSDARPIVGRDLSSLILGEVDPASVTEPVQPAPLRKSEPLTSRTPLDFPLLPRIIAGLGPSFRPPTRHRRTDPARSRSMSLSERRSTAGHELVHLRRACAAI